MSRKRHKPEEIVAKLRQVDVLLAQGQTVADAIRAIGITVSCRPRSGRGTARMAFGLVSTNCIASREHHGTRQES
jgi:hypothetical protein